MKIFAMILCALALLVAGYVYFFPEAEELSYHCTLCGRSRVYYIVAGTKYGGTMFNLQVRTPGDTSPAHHHLYVDPQTGGARAVPRWTLHPSGPQSQ